MPVQHDDLHGNAPDNADVALLLIDVINDLEFDGGETLLTHALPMAAQLARLKRLARQAGIPAVYVNDNFGRWQSDFAKLLAHCMGEGVRGRPLAEQLRPEPDDYFVLKPKHSGFYSTTLDLLLRALKVTTLLLTGLTADVCVLFTANDAYMRDFHLVVPADCVASLQPEENRHALLHMQRVLKADIRPSTALDLQALKRQARPVDRGSRGTDGSDLITNTLYTPLGLHILRPSHAFRGGLQHDRAAVAGIDSRAKPL
jgi:nicotinamidase-related amidase